MTQAASNETTKLWSGQFGDDYTGRNEVEPASRLNFWDEVIRLCDSESSGKVTISSALEIGCNRGHNMVALQKRGVRVVQGIDVNDSALTIARDTGLVVDKCEANKLLDYTAPESFDLSFTAGVLIHIPTTDLLHVMGEIASVSRRYVLAVEYEDTRETDVNYRGSLGRLWRRPYGHIYTRLGLRLVQKWAAPAFDNSTAWLFRKD